MVHRKSFDGKLGKTTSSYELNIRNNIGGMIISNSKCEKRLDINIDNKQTFESHVRSLCKNASQKLNTSVFLCSTSLDVSQLTIKQGVPWTTGV